MRRRASTWTVPMKPVPMTAAPMIGDPPHATFTHWLVRASPSRLVGDLWSATRPIPPRPLFGLSPLPILLCHVKCKSPRGRRMIAGDGAPDNGSVRPDRWRIGRPIDRRATGRPRPAARRGARRAGHRPRRDPARAVALAVRAGRADRPRPGDRRPAGRRADRARPGHRGRGRPEHRRPPAAPADVPRRRRARPRRGPRRDQHRRRGHEPRRPDPRPPRRARPDRGRPGACASAASTRCSTRCCETTQASAGPAVGDRHRRPGPGRVRGRPPDLAADHARLGRLSDPRALRRALRGAGLGRQRRQRPRARRVAVRAWPPATTTSSS